MLKIFIFVNTVFILFSCRDNISVNYNLIDFYPYEISLNNSIDNIKTLKLSDLCEEITYIPLETNPSNVIHEIRQIALTDSFVFVSDFQSLFQFDLNGKFLRQVGKQGRGPEEYIFIRDICVNEEKRLIIISSPLNRKLLEYDFNGRFVKSISIQVNFGDLIIRDSNSLILHMPNVPSPVEGKVLSWCIIDSEGKLLGEIHNSLKRKSSPGFSIIESPLYYYNGSAHFMEFGIDTLYFFHNSVKKPYAIFNLGTQKMDPDPIWDQESRDKLADRLWIYNIYEDDKYLYLNLNRGLSLEPFPCVFNKNTKEITILKEQGFVNDLDGGPAFWPKEVYRDSILIDYINASKLILSANSKQSEAQTPENEAELVLDKLIDEINETDNPILMICKLKKPKNN